MEFQSSRGKDHRPLALLVDHDSDTCEMYAEYLASHGISTVQAQDGTQGLAKATSMRPDIITTEIRIPGLDGLALTRRLRKGEDTKGIPVIVLTASAMPGEIRRAKHSGCAAVLLKPCLPEALLAEIRRILPQAPHVDATAPRP